MSRSNLAPRAGAPQALAFSLIELLVVMGVIAILAGIGLPALRGLGGTSDQSAAQRQLLDDLAYARLKAINDRTTVYVVFASDLILRQPWNSSQRREIAKMANLQFTSYALYARRSLGDQPGWSTPRYITDWRSLPDGTFFPTNKFLTLGLLDDHNKARRQLPLAMRPFELAQINFPRATNAPINLHVLAFDYQGRLTQPEDAIVPISRGSLVLPQDQNTNSLETAEVIETPRNNYTNNPVIRVDWLTGRARVLQPENVDYAAHYFKETHP